MQINGVGKKLICQNGNETFVRGGFWKIQPFTKHDENKLNEEETNEQIIIFTLHSQMALDDEFIFSSLTVDINK